MIQLKRLSLIGLFYQQQLYIHSNAVESEEGVIFTSLSSYYSPVAVVVSGHLSWFQLLQVNNVTRKQRRKDRSKRRKLN